MAAASMHVPRLSFNCLLPHWQPLQRSAGGYVPDSFQITTLGLTSCNILLIPFKSGVSITHRPVVLLNMSHWPSLPNILGVPLPGAGPAFWGALLWSLDPVLLGESHCNCSYPPFCGLPPQSYGSWPYVSLPPYLFYCGLLFISSAADDLFSWCSGCSHR